MEMNLVRNWQQLCQELERAGSFNIMLIFVAILFPICILVLYTKSGRSRNKASLPSPPRLPIIGNLHQLGPSLHRSFDALSERYGPLLLLHLGSIPTLLVSSTELAREVSKNHDAIFANRPRVKGADVLFYGCTDIAFSPYNEYWRRVKKISVLQLLNLKRVQSFRFVREDEVAEIVDRIRDCCLSESSVDLGKMMVSIASNIISRVVLGRKYEGENGSESFGELARKAMELVGAFCFEDLFPLLRWIDDISGYTTRLNDTFGKVDAFLNRVIDEHEVESDNDDKKNFLDILLDLQKQGMPEIVLSNDNIKAILMDMLTGGTDTAAATMEWVMAELAKNPTILEKAQEEVRRIVGKDKVKVEESDICHMNYLKCIITETLRLHAPFLIARETIANVTLAGYEIPEKTRVLVNLWAIQRCGESWDRPKEFVPERFLNNSGDFKGLDPSYAPFGWGRRSCPGTSFAMAEMEYVIANLLYWFDWKLPGGASEDSLDMDDVFLQVIRKKISLCLVPVLHTF